MPAHGAFALEREKPEMNRRSSYVRPAAPRFEESPSPIRGTRYESITIMPDDPDFANIEEFQCLRHLGKKAPVFFQRDNENPDCIFIQDFWKKPIGKLDISDKPDEEIHVSAEDHYFKTIPDFLAVSRGNDVTFRRSSRHRSFAGIWVQNVDDPTQKTSRGVKITSLESNDFLGKAVRDRLENRLGTKIRGKFYALGLEELSRLCTHIRCNWDDIDARVVPRTIGGDENVLEKVCFFKRSDNRSEETAIPRDDFYRGLKERDSDKSPLEMSYADLRKDGFRYLNMHFFREFTQRRYENEQEPSVR